MKLVDERRLKAIRPAPEQFTGGVWQTLILQELRPDGLRALRFSYQPGARSVWHVHDGEQALQVLTGRGVITRSGERRGRELLPGDWVHVEPGEKHWHGATADDIFVHMTVTGSGRTHLHDPVSDEEYRASHDFRT